MGYYLDTEYDAEDRRDRDYERFERDATNADDYISEHGTPKFPRIMVLPRPVPPLVPHLEAALARIDAAFRDGHD